MVMLANYPAHLCDSGRGNTPGNVSSHGRTGPEKLWDTPSFDLQMNSSLSRTFFKCRLKLIKRHNKWKEHILLSSPVFICPAHQFQFIFFFFVFAVIQAHLVGITAIYCLFILRHHFL